MSTPSADPSQAPTPRRLILAPRLIRHSWTNDELNLLAYHRARNWTLDRIRKTYFPSLTKKSLIRAYSRLPIEERAYRTSIFAALGTTPYGASRSEDLTHSNPVPGPSHYPRPVSQPERHLETVTLSSPSFEKGDGSTASDNGNKNRYNLRSNRPIKFQSRKSQYLVNRLHFPNFFKSYREHLKLHTVPDRDYVPPSHSPTPDLSDHSPSSISSQPSDISSLELFGLEPRSPSPSDHRPTVNPGQVSDVSSSEFFSSEECLPTP
jgi:hypothetical protein